MDAIYDLYKLADLSISYLQSQFDKLNNLDPHLFIFIVIISVILSLFSRRLTTVVITATLAVLGMLLLFPQLSERQSLAIFAFWASLLVIFAGVSTQRREARLDREIAELKEAVQHLEAAEQRIFLQLLNVRGPAQNNGRAAEQATVPATVKEA